MSGKKERLTIFATSKVSTVDAYQQVHQVGRIANFDAEEFAQDREPLSDNPLEPASWKAHQINRLFAVPANVILQILAADTIFSIGGKKQHKAGDEIQRQPFGTQIPTDADTMEPYIQEAQDWYKNPFTAVWMNGFIYHIPYVRNRAAQLDVTIDFPTGIHPDRIRETFNPKLNARMPLAEEAKVHNAQMHISNGGRGESIEVNHELGLQIIKSRVLTVDWQDQLLNNTPAHVYRDRFGNRRSVVEIDLKRKTARD